jgi:ribosome-associated protein
LAKRSVDRSAAKKLAIEAARIAYDNNSEDVIVLDLRGLSPVTDYFVIATGTSGPQMRAVAEKVGEYGRSVGQKPWHSAGLEGGQWAIMDFVDVVVHVFGPAFRRYYDLELIWGSAPKVRWKRRAVAKPKARSARGAESQDDVAAGDRTESDEPSEDA